MEIKKFSKKEFYVGETVDRVCPICEGKGGFTCFEAIDENTSEDVYHECEMCGGAGRIGEELRECPHCGELVMRCDMEFTSDRYGIPKSLVCLDCFDEGDKEWEYDYMDAGECLDEPF